MAKKTNKPPRPEIGRRYRFRGVLGGERIADVLDIDTRRGLIKARDVLGGEFRWSRIAWRRECVERVE